MIKNIIEKKLKSLELSEEEIKYFVEKYVAGEILEEQAATLVCAIYLNGMTKQEIFNLTSAMAFSGKTIDFSDVDSNIVDKHSTGGVGDKTSLILIPLLSAIGINIAKMSGRSLGFTGGTIDKFEVFPGFKTDLEIGEFKENIRKCGMGICSQTSEIAIADKKIYNLRDKISCVDNISLIASSIMSKKIACGAKKLVIELTVGSGAFMKDVKQAKKLANEMIEIGNKFGIQTVCVLTNMEQPLGRTVGNLLEVQEAIDFLNNENVSEDLEEVILELGSHMFCLYYNYDLTSRNLKSAKEILKDGIRNKIRIPMLKTLVNIQHGDSTYVTNPTKFKKHKYSEEIQIKQGYVKSFETNKIGEMAHFLNGDIEVNYKIGDMVSNKPMFVIHSDDKQKIEKVKEDIKQFVEISKEEVEKPKRILGVVS